MEPWLEAFARANFSRSSDTAHDLKTPLNIAVLNLELLRMRLRKLSGAEDDEKVAAYAQAIETELRRMARIFDSFFVLSTPPRGESPEIIDLVPICLESAADAGFPCVGPEGPLAVRAHAARIRQAFQLFFDGAGRILTTEGRQAEISGDTHFRLTATGAPASEEFEESKVFKFYYTDQSGNPDLSLASARLIVETYGGELNAAGESDKVSLRMSVPLGDK
jgi:nitrogen fixation/metabolism regulation signal transduction histidine kinase